MTIEPNCRHCPASRLRLVEVGHRIEALCRMGARFVALGPTDKRGLVRIAPHGECREWEGR